MKAQPPTASPSIRLGAAQIKLLDRLCSAVAVSGDEQEVREIVLEQVRPHAAELQVDALGNVLVTCQSSGETRSEGKRLRVLLAAHMDEIGFMLTYDDGDGLYRFETVGGIDERQLAGKAVWVGRDHLPGVIGAKPIHLTTADERKRSLSIDSLRIDVGPGSNSKVKPGDRATFATPFTRLGPSLRGKALDDRLGVATLIQLVKNPPPGIDLQLAFTVQEEVGLRGAQVAAYALEPDLAIAVDSTPAMDLPAWEESGAGLVENLRYNTRLGEGPAIYIADGSTLADPRLVRHFVDTAEALRIPYQIRQPGGGGTDAGAMHLTRAGVPSLSVSIPGRYAHTAAGLARLADWQHTLDLLYQALGRLSPSLLSAER